MTNYKVAFLVLSCDKYSDLWNPFAQLFERYWPDCPFDKYFASNQVPFNKYGFLPVLMGEDKTWSSGLQTALFQLKDKYDYVLITLEDVMITDKVDTLFVASCIRECINRDGNYLKMYKKTKFPKSQEPYIEESRQNIPYRHNCVYALWKIETLLNVLVPDENAWEFEKIGAKRTATMNGFYCVVHNAFVLANTVVKGKWVRRELNKIMTELPDISINREILSAKEEQRLYRHEKLFRYFFSYVPLSIINLLLKIFSKR
jgi:hypothetical protein